MPYILFSPLHDDVCAVCDSMEEAQRIMQEFCRINGVVEQEMGIIKVPSNRRISLNDMLDDKFRRVSW